MWCVINAEDALRHEEVIRHCAEIGDFRELKLGVCVYVYMNVGIYMYMCNYTGFM